MKYLLFILFPSISFAACDVSEVLPNFAPATEWNLKSNTYAGISWFSATPKPTQAQVDQAISTCREKPTAEDRLVALEAHKVLQDTAIQSIAAKTGTPIILPTATENP